MHRAYYSSEISEFILTNSDYVLGQLCIHNEFETTDLQKNAWRREISILKEQFSTFTSGEIAFEYSIPRVGHRIDVVVITRGVIFLLEFKVGEQEYRSSTDDQVMDYALDLKYFHEGSKDRFIIPISISTEADNEAIDFSLMEDKISKPLHCNKDTVKPTIQFVLSRIHDNDLAMNSWMKSRYAPTPTIIEAAQALYRQHSVSDISRSDAGAQNLSATTGAVNRIIDHCKTNHKKAICFITGVPGAGKTLAGLNIANERHQFDNDEHAVFLSGNGPLVDVLQEALARDKASREGINKEMAKRETKAFIQIIHKFRDEALTSQEAPIEKVVIFDEAQRAWNRNALTNFMAQKKGIADFNQSEPEFLISIMDRHKDWAVIICLVGGGQEIYTGEAGIQDWFYALQNRFLDWEIYISDKIAETEYIGSSDIHEFIGEREYQIIPSLHLAVSLRSFRSEKLSEFIKCILDNDPINADTIYTELSKTYPIYLSRDFEAAKDWIRKKARGTERYGLLASSEGKRLRSIGIWVQTDINHVSWFLNGKDNADSSYYFEVVASEFKIQGLEIDYSLLAWDADLRYVNGAFDYYKFRGTIHGTHWNHIGLEQRQKYLKNAYRVLLTRARQGLVIFVPLGVSSDQDPSRDSVIYDGIYNYLLSCGIKELSFKKDSE